MSDRTKRTALFLCVGLTAALLGGCGGEQDAAPKLNVILISIDTLRADHLGCYGHPMIRTPNIDRLASEGVRFEQCIVAAPVTLPSHSSMLTGVYPFVHKVRDNGTFRLHEDNQTLAEIMHQAGYATAAQVGAFVLNHSFGLDQGFDVYRDVGYSMSQSAGRAESEIRAEQVTDGAVELLDQIGGRPFFMFVHYFDPHQPYAPPAPFAEKYFDPYSGEIAYVDEQIGRLLAALLASGLDQNTLIVLTSDHGEGLGQHEEATHAFFVYDTTLRVPLIFWRPGVTPTGKVVKQTVRSIDIAPTILSMADAPALQHGQGVDLSQTWGDKPVSLELDAYSETFYTKYNLGYSQLRALHAGDWKYILAPTPELYNVNDDPAESRNLIASQPELASAMRAELKAIVDAGPVVVNADQAMLSAGADTLRRLESLGYVAGGASTSPSPPDGEAALFEPDGPNPMEHTREIRLVTHAVGLSQTNRHAEIEKTIRELLALVGQDSEKFVWAHAHLAGALAAQGKLTEALPHFDFAIKARPEDGQMYTMKGLVLRALSRDDEALATFRQAVTLEPVFASTHLHLGGLLSKRGLDAEAEEQFRLAIEKDILLKRAYRGLAAALRSSGRESEAAALLDENIAKLVEAGDMAGAQVLMELRGTWTQELTNAPD